MTNRELKQAHLSDNVILFLLNVAQFSANLVSSIVF